jgi:replicative DNA helicase
MAFAGNKNRGRDRDRDSNEVLTAAAAAVATAQGNVPPHDLEAERAVLGGVLLDNAALATVGAIVAASDFYHPSHAVIFESIQALGARNEPVDVVTLTAELRARERLNTVGGVQYLGELTDTVPTIAHIENHARIVADLAQVRRMIATAHEIVARGFGERGSADAFLDFAASKVFEIAQKRSKSTLIPLEQAIQEAFERIEKTLERGARITGIETGFRDLDTLTAGMSPGQLIIIAARPAMGKTSFVLNITAHAARTTRKPVLFFSLEMPRIELANRLMCADAGVDQARLRSNMLTQDDMMALTDAASKLFNLPIYIDDSGDLTLLELRAKARRMKNERDLALIIIDYLQLMKASREGMESREREISEISRGLKSLAKELEVPIVALSQLNRSPETRSGKDKRPQLSDLRESGAIEQDADNVMFIYRDEVYNKDTEDRGIAEIIVAKQRNGPTDTVRLRFIRELTKFENLAEDEAEYRDASVAGVEDAGGGDDGGM